MSEVQKSVELDWDLITKMINDGTLKLDAAAKTFGIKASVLRAELIEYYGDLIVFKRGRKGGVYTNPDPRSVTLNNTAKPVS